MSTIRYTLFLFALLSGCLAGEAQRPIISVGGGASLFIQTGTIFSADSLVLTPGADFNFASNVIQESPVAVPFNPNPSINRVYSLNSPVNFTGTMQVYYRVSELNGNTEATLFLTDSTVSSTWNAEMTSTVNTASHYVQLITAAHSFNSVTASPVIIPLPLDLISFTGSWQGNEVPLEWLVEQSGELGNFAVESCSDGKSWKEIGKVSGIQSNGLYTYHFTDKDPSANSMFYRIRIILISGQTSYSYIVKVDKGGSGDDIRLVAGNNSVAVYFMNTYPSSIRVINTLGQIVRVDNNSRREYDLNGLFRGVYFLQYQLNGQWNVRRFLVQ